MTGKRKAQLLKNVRSYWDRMTPEERSTEMRRRNRIAKRNRKHAAQQRATRTPTQPHKETATHAPSSLPSDLIAYAFGYTQAWLHSYADRLGVAGPTLAARVGKLLQSSAGR